MDIKKEKSKSFWGGFLAGAAALGVLITFCAVVVILTQATVYKQIVENGGQVFSNGNDLNIFGNIGGSDYAAIQGGDIITDDIVKKADEIGDMIDDYFLFEENYDPDKMEESIYDGIMASLDDPYSVYYTQEEFEDLLTDSEGIYYGIGAYVQIDEDTKLPKLTEVFKDSPAEKAGLRGGDLIKAADGTELEGMELSDAVALIKGPQYTNVLLTIVREGVAKPFDVSVTRDKVEAPTVTYEMKEDSIGYIKLTEFDDVTYDQFVAAYKDLTDQGMKSLIIDLRNNPGGNLSTVVDICGEILPKGVITYTIDKQGNRNDYNGKGKHVIDIPLVVLVNGYSASASELMTGAIRDYGKGTIIGTNTFGKGIVQQLFYLSDGSGIKITTSRYYTPNGECIHGTGIKPDIEIELDTELLYSEEAIDNQLQKAIEYLKTN